MTTTSKRALGFWALLALVIGNMIGSGIYLLPATLALAALLPLSVVASPGLLGGAPGADTAEPASGSAAAAAAMALASGTAHMASAAVDAAAAAAAEGEDPPGVLKPPPSSVAEATAPELPEVGALCVAQRWSQESGRGGCATAPLLAPRRSSCCQC